MEESKEQLHKPSWWSHLEHIDRRIIYLLVAASLAIPLIMDVALRPAEMSTAEAMYQAVDALEREDGKLVLIAADWGPGTMAENKPQTALAIEHLFRKRVPFALITVYTLGEPFLRSLPLEVAARLEKEFPGEKWEYGKDWVNFGYRPGGSIMIQGLAKSDNLVEELEVDANQFPLDEIEVMKGVRSIKDIQMLMEFTGLVGVFNSWIQFFQGPTFVHGCTSITIPEAFIYFSSKQIVGLFEGVAGAAWYEVLLSEHYSTREPVNIAISINTGLSFAQLIIMGFVIIGNLGMVVNLIKRGGRDD